MITQSEMSRRGVEVFRRLRAPDTAALRMCREWECTRGTWAADIAAVYQAHQAIFLGAPTLDDPSGDASAARTCAAFLYIRGANNEC